MAKRKLNRTFEEFKDVLRALHSRGQASSGSVGPNNITLIKDATELDTLIKNDKSSFGHRLLRLKPPITYFDDHLIGLAVDWDFSPGYNRAKIEIGFICPPKKSFYQRFEFGAPGKHQYWHSQFLHNFTSASSINSPGSAANFIHQSTPAIPLPAHNATCALACVTLAIYGRDMDGDLKSILRQMDIHPLVKGILS